MQHTLAEPVVMSAHEAPVKLVAVSPDGRYIASADTNRQLKVWQDGQPIIEKNLKIGKERFWAPNRIRSLAFSLDSAKLYVAAGVAVSALEMPSGEKVWQRRRKPTLGFVNTRPQSISISSMGDMAVAYDDGAVEVHGERLIEWRDNDAPWLMTYLRDGRRLAGTDFVSVCIWDAASGAKLAKYKPSQWKAYALSASPVADYLAVRALKDVEIWDMDSGERTASFPVMPGFPTVCFHPTLELLAVGDADGICIWRFDGQLMSRIDAGGLGPLSLTFSPSGGRLFAGCSDGNIRAWEIEDRHK